MKIPLFYGTEDWDTSSYSKKLVNDGVHSTLDFTDFDTCVDCIKGKSNKSKKGAKRSSTIVEIIHSNICCPDIDAHG